MKGSVMPKPLEPQVKKQRKSKPQIAEPQTPKERPIKYPTLVGKVGWLSAGQARDLLLWKQSKDKDNPFTEFLLKDLDNVPTKCLNVEKQRPFYVALAKQWMGEILGGHWNGDGGESNGEPIIVGKTATVLDGKHRLIGLVLAEQAWLKNPDKYPYWKTEAPKIHCFINFGVREDVKSVNTINTGKPRTLSDAIFASGLFGTLDASKSKDKRLIKNLSKMLDYAVRLLWSRTGAQDDAFAPKRTHAESLDFIQRHPRLMECVRHIYEENGKDDKLRYYPSPGFASALLYMMGCSKTIRENEEGTGYTQVSCPTEDLLDWSMWQKALQFWVDLADPNCKTMNYLRQTVANLLDGGNNAFREERMALIIKSWWQYANSEVISAKTISYETVKDEDGRVMLAETPLIGEAFGDVCGIDIGGIQFKG